MNNVYDNIESEKCVEVVEAVCQPSQKKSDEYGIVVAK